MTMRRHLQIGVLLLATLTAACLSTGGVTPPAVSPQPIPGGPGTQGPGPGGELVTFEIFVHDLQTPARGLDGVAATCGGETRTTNGDGTAHFDVVSGRQLDCSFSREGYDPQTASAVPGIDARLPVWMHRVFTAPPVHADPLFGQLRIESAAYVDDRGPRIPVCLHAGDLIGHGLLRGLDAVLPTLDLAARYGYHCVRSWFQLKITTGTWLPGPTTHGWDPRDNPGRFVEILQAGAARGLKWNLAAGGIKGLSNADEDQLFDLVASAIDQVGAQHFARIVGGNEIRDTGDSDDQDPRELERLVNRVRSRHPRILYGLAVWTGTEDEGDLRRFTASWMRDVLIHGFRSGQVHDKIRHYFNNGYEGPGRWGRAPGQVGTHQLWHDEPLGVGRLVSASGNVHQLGAAEMQLIAVAAAIGRGSWTFFSGPGVVLGDEPWEAMPGLAETPAILRELPQDLHRWDIRGHAGPGQTHRIHAVRGDRPNVRADYAIDNDTGRFVEIVYGPPNEPKDLPQVRGTTDERVLVESPWGRAVVGRLR
jgi:hypothetical protein